MLKRTLPGGSVVICIVAALFVACGQPASVPMVDSDSSTDVHEMTAGISTGTYSVSFYTHPTRRDARIQYLQKIGRVLGDSNALDDLLLKVVDGEPMFAGGGHGLSKQEWRKLIDVLRMDQLIEYSDTLDIVNNESSLSFRGRGRLGILDSLRINLNSGNASWGEISLDLVVDSVDISLPEMMTGDSLANYQLYRGPGGLLGLVPSIGKCEVLIGRLVPGNRLYIEFYTNIASESGLPVPELIIVVLEPSGSGISGEK